MNLKQRMNLFVLLTLVLNFNAFTNTSDEVEVDRNGVLNIYVEGSGMDFNDPGTFETADMNRIVDPETQKAINLHIDDHFLDSDIVRTTADIVLVGGAVYTAFEADEDKQKHFLVGVLISAGVRKWAKVYYKGDRHEELKVFLASSGAAVLAGLIKEVIDDREDGNKADWEDFGYTAVAGISYSLGSFKW